MHIAALGVGSAQWRAARAAVVLGAVMHDALPPDDALAGLAELGGEWLDVLRDVRAEGTQAISLILPRPGDPRGAAFPRGTDAQAAVGWGCRESSFWLIPHSHMDWLVHRAPGVAMSTTDPQEADRRLREAVVTAAHAADITPEVFASSAVDDVHLLGESIVDTWVGGEPPMRGDRRYLAARGLRVLMAAMAARPQDAVASSHVAELDAAARSAVEAAYSTSRTAH